VLNTSSILRTGNEKDVFIGVGAGDKMITNLAENDVYIGWHAGFNVTNHSNSVIIGSQAKELSTSSTGNSVHIGAKCGQSTSGGSQTMIGFNAGPSVTSNCTIVGFQAAPMATSCSNSTIIGGNSFPVLNNGTDNTCVGEGAGSGISSGSFNSFFGRSAGASSGALTFATAIGANASVTTSNTIQLGRIAMDAVSCGSSLSVNGSQVTDSFGHLVRVEGSGSVSITVGSGAGSGANAVLSNATDSSGQISLTTGATPTANAVLVTLTFAHPYSSTPVMIITPANSNAAALTGTSAPFVDQNQTTTSRISSNSALTGSIVYSWWYHVMH